MMIADLHPGDTEGMQDSDVEFDQRTVTPQGFLAAGVEPETLGNKRQQVVSAGIDEIARADFGTHVPAIERRKWVVDTTDAQTHVGDGRYGMPAQSEFGEPGVFRMGELYLEHEVAGHVEQLWPAFDGFDDKRQDLKRTAPALPAEAAHGLGEVDVTGVTNDAAVASPITGITDDLLVPYPRSRTHRGVRSEDGDHRTNAAIVVGLAQVLAQVPVDLLGCAGIPPVQHTQALPVQTPYAAAGVAPGHASAEDQLGAGVRVGARLSDLGSDLTPTFVQRTRLVGVLGVKQSQELLGLLHVGYGVLPERVPRAGRFGCGCPRIRRWYRLADGRGVHEKGRGVHWHPAGGCGSGSVPRLFGRAWKGRRGQSLRGQGRPDGHLRRGGHRHQRCCSRACGAGV